MTAEFPATCYFHSSLVRTKILRRVWERSLRGPIKVLDIGCGHGTLWQSFDRDAPEIEIHGFDPVAGAVAHARENLKRNSSRFHVGRVDDPPEEILAAAPFDVVASHSVLEHVYRQERFYTCLDWVTGPGSLLLLSWGTDHFKQGLKVDLRNLASRLLAAVGIDRYYAKDVDDAVALKSLADLGFERLELRYHSVISLKRLSRLLEGEEHRRFIDLMIEVDERLNACDDPARLRPHIDEVFFRGVRKAS